MAQVEREIRIDAPPETVFPYFVDPEKVTRWTGVALEIDPRPGGIYRQNVTGSHFARGEFVEVSAPHRVVWTWGWEGGEPAPGTTTVEITLVADGDGTIVKLLHRDLPDEWAAPHAEGWDHYLPRLQVAAAGGDPGPDEWVTEEART